MGSEQRPQNAEGPVRNIWTIAWDAGEGREPGWWTVPLAMPALGQGPVC